MATADFVKCVCIILMVLFHLVCIEEAYPYAKAVVYTFHMPVFLFLSGLFANMGKPASVFGRYILWIFIPYAVMEAAYTGMSAVLPVRGGVESLSPAVILHNVFLRPMGPYWYLHTLVVALLACYLCSVACRRLPTVLFLIVFSLCLGLLSYIGLLSADSALYFALGVAANRFSMSFDTFFRPAAWAFVPLVILCCFPENLDRFSIAGAAIVYFAVCSMLWVYRFIPIRIKTVMHFIGRNTLPILLFSPIFTMASKAFLPLFGFDPTLITFACVAVPFAVGGSLFIAWAMDKTRFSVIFFGKPRSISAYSTQLD